MTQEQTVQLIFIILPFVLATIVLPLVKWLISKLPVEKQQTATTLVYRAVQAVEQLSQNNTSNLTSDAKKALAKDFAEALLKQSGISLDEHVINTLIESAVYLLNQTTTTVISTPVTAKQTA